MTLHPLRRHSLRRHLRRAASVRCGACGICIGGCGGMPGDSGIDAGGMPAPSVHLGRCAGWRHLRHLHRRHLRHWHLRRRVRDVHQRRGDAVTLSCSSCGEYPGIFTFPHALVAASRQHPYRPLAEPPPASFPLAVAARLEQAGKDTTEAALRKAVAPPAWEVPYSRPILHLRLKIRWRWHPEAVELPSLEVPYSHHVLDLQLNCDGGRT